MVSSLLILSPLQKTGLPAYMQLTIIAKTKRSLFLIHGFMPRKCSKKGWAKQ
jgi:hypothetical protein